MYAWTGYLKGGEGSPSLGRSPAGASVTAFRCFVQAVFSFKLGIAAVNTMAVGYAAGLW
jgi:hypothetical protein